MSLFKFLFLRTEIITLFILFGLVHFGLFKYVLPALKSINFQPHIYYLILIILGTLITASVLFSWVSLSSKIEYWCHNFQNK